MTTQKLRKWKSTPVGLIRAFEASMAQMAYTTQREMLGILDMFAANKVRSKGFHASQAMVS